MKINRTLGWAVALAAAAALSACWDDDDDDEEAVVVTPPPAVTAEVPPSASESEAGLVTYLRALLDASADTLEPVDIGRFTPQATETSEPAAVN